MIDPYAQEWSEFGDDGEQLVAQAAAGDNHDH